MHLRPGLRPDSTGGARCAPQTSYLVYGEEWKGRVEDRVDYIRTENFVGGTELGQHPTPSSSSPAEAPVWKRLDPPVGRGNTGGSPAFFSLEV